MHHAFCALAVHRRHADHCVAFCHCADHAVFHRRHFRVRCAPAQLLAHRRIRRIDRRIQRRLTSCLHRQLAVIQAHADDLDLSWLYGHDAAVALAIARRYRDRRCAWCDGSDLAIVDHRDFRRIAAPDERAVIGRIARDDRRIQRAALSFGERHALLIQAHSCDRHFLGLDHFYSTCRTDSIDRFYPNNCISFTQCGHVAFLVYCGNRRYRRHPRQRRIIGRIDRLDHRAQLLARSCLQRHPRLAQTDRGDRAVDRHFT